MSVEETSQDIPQSDDLLYEAWGIIANASGWIDDPEGAWTKAAIVWRDRWHKTLPSQIDIQSLPEGQIFDWDPEKTSIQEAVGNAIGHASLCWTEAPTGLFDDQRASRIVQELIDFIDDKRYREG